MSNSILATADYQILVVVGDKVREKRGRRTRKQIADASNNSFTEQTLYGWEKEKWAPEPKDVPILAEALGCAISDITKPLPEAI